MERANLLNPENEAYRFKLNALREQVGLPSATMSWKERATGILHHTNGCAFSSISASPHSPVTSSPSPQDGSIIAASSS